MRIVPVPEEVEVATCPHVHCRQPVQVDRIEGTPVFRRHENLVGGFDCRLSGKPVGGNALATLKTVSVPGSIAY